MPDSGNIKEMLEQLVREGIYEIELREVPFPSAESSSRLMAAFTEISQDKTGQKRARIILNSAVSEADKRDGLARELTALKATEYVRSPQDAFDDLWFEDELKTVDLTVSSVIVPERKVAEGVLVRSVSVVWGAVVEQLNEDWTKAYDIPSRVWEEIIAGAYSRAGFDEVVLTPRSGDHGRDVIAIKKGVGCVKIIGSVKAYKAGHLVDYDDVRALIGVMSGERDTSKGIITTTSDFRPHVRQDPFIAPFLPTRLELMNGQALQQWLKDLLDKTKG
jgi:restriction system protein